MYYLTLFKEKQDMTIFQHKLSLQLQLFTAGIFILDISELKYCTGFFSHVFIVKDCLQYLL